MGQEEVVADGRAVSSFGPLVVCIPPQKWGLHPRSLLTGFVVDKLASSYVFRRVGPPSVHSSVCPQWITRLP